MVRLSSIRTADFFLWLLVYPVFHFSSASRYSLVKHRALKILLQLCIEKKITKHFYKEKRSTDMHTISQCCMVWFFKSGTGVESLWYILYSKFWAAWEQQGSDSENEFTHTSRLNPLSNITGIYHVSCRKCWEKFHWGKQCWVLE